MADHGEIVGNVAGRVRRMSVRCFAVERLPVIGEAVVPACEQSELSAYDETVVKMLFPIWRDSWLGIDVDDSVPCPRG